MAPNLERLNGRWVAYDFWGAAWRITKNSYGYSATRHGKAFGRTERTLAALAALIKEYKD